MAKARRLSVVHLESVRLHALEHGGVLFKRTCPMPGCHSAVVRHERSLVCLTCGWTRSGTEWGAEVFEFSAEEAARGSLASYRGLVLLADPRRWTRLIRKLRRRGEELLARQLEVATRCLGPPAGNPGNAAPAAAARQPPAAGEGQGGTRGSTLREGGPLREAQHSFLPEACEAPGPAALRRHAMQKLDGAAPEVLIFTDGGCDPNPGPGGWAALLWTAGWELEISGGEPRTTNNRMELTAALQGLKALKRPSRVTVVTDSEYLFKGMTGWITSWSRRRWRKKGGELLNASLWQDLARAALGHETYWAWTRGHAGQAENERCDELATAMTRRARQECGPPEPHQVRRPRSGPLPAVSGSPTSQVWFPGAGESLL